MSGEHKPHSDHLTALDDVFDVAMQSSGLPFNERVNLRTAYHSASRGLLEAAQERLARYEEPGWTNSVQKVIELQEQLETARAEATRSEAYAEERDQVAQRFEEQLEAAQRGAQDGDEWRAAYELAVEKHEYEKREWDEGVWVHKIWKERAELAEASLALADELIDTARVPDERWGDMHIDYLRSRAAEPNSEGAAGDLNVSSSAPSEKQRCEPMGEYEECAMVECPDCNPAKRPT